MANGKMRYGFTPDGPNRCAGTWTENRGGGYLGYAQGISVGGLIGIVVATQGSVPAVITTNGGSLQMVSTIFPAAANQAVTWSIINGTGQASISGGGLVTAIGDGTVWAKAIAVQDITVHDSLLITISNQAPLAPTVVTNPASNIITTTATLNGTVTAHNASTAVSFNWGTTIAYGNTVAATPSPVTGNTPTAVSAGISGLIVGTTYHFRCTGTNSVGTNNGSDMTFVAGCQPLTTAGSITGPANVCNNSTGKVYSISTIPAATGYTWTVPAGAVITAGQNTISITVSFGTTSGNVSVFATNSCSTSATSTLAVSVDAPPVPTITGPNNPCQNAGQATYFTEPGMTNYAWTVSSGGTISSGAGTYQIQVAWTIAGAQTVTVNYTSLSGCSANTPTTSTVTVNPVPDPAGGITGTPVLCAGSTGIAYSVAAISNAVTYVWLLPTGATIASGATTNNITVDFSSGAVSGNITVEGNNLCGDGAPSPPFAVTVNPIPAAPVITYNFPTLSSSAPSGNQWYFSPTQGGSGTAIPGATGQTYDPTEVGFYWSIVTLNSCSSDPSNVVNVTTVGVASLKNSTVEIYPVPNSGIFTVTLTSPGKEDFSIRIFNLTGEKIYDSGLIPVNNTLNKEINLRPVTDGIFSVEIRNGNSMIVKKVVVKQ
jgi:hypothetical protein